MNDNRLFVGNLPWSVTEDQLKALFTPFGDVVSVKLITDKFTGRSKGFGFVEFAKAEDAQKAISELHEKKENEGRMMVVNVAKPMKERSPGRDFGGGGGSNRGGYGGRDSGGRGGYHRN